MFAFYADIACLCFEYVVLYVLLICIVCLLDTGCPDVIESQATPRPIPQKNTNNYTKPQKSM